MIYLSQLARLTPKKIQRTAAGVRVSKVKAFIDKDAKKGRFKTIRANVRSNKAYGSGKTWHINVRLYGTMRSDGVMKPQNKAWVHCDCPYFRYHVEVADAARGASNVITSTGAYPKIRNPRMKPHLCKHLFAAIPVITKAKAKRRKVAQIDDVELEQLISLLEPFIPTK